MKTLYIMRHAEKNINKTYAHDYDVELTAQGFEDVKSVAYKLKEEDSFPDLIVSSPAIRARQTAETLCDVLEYNKSIMYNEVIYQAFLNEIVESINYTFDTVQTLLIIGHNPSLTALSLSLGGVKEEISTSNIIKIEFDCDSWTSITKENAKYIKTFKP
ncbi:MAG: SixA phosphatase family protein [Halarcobacter sp.]